MSNSPKHKRKGPRLPRPSPNKEKGNTKHKRSKHNLYAVEGEQVGDARASALEGDVRSWVCHHNGCSRDVSGLAKIQSRVSEPSCQS